jgi:hypothetical protein
MAIPSPCLPLLFCAISIGAVKNFFCEIGSPIFCRRCEKFSSEKGNRGLRRHYRRRLSTGARKHAQGSEYLHGAMRGISERGCRAVSRTSIRDRGRAFCPLSSRGRGVTPWRRAAMPRRWRSCLRCSRRRAVCSARERARRQVMHPLAAVREYPWGPAQLGGELPFPICSAP